MEWQPIETAPKDGTRIRARREGYEYGPGNTTCFWSPAEGRWLCAELFINPHERVIATQPTHWRPTTTATED
jgi:hypothetical protein